MPAMRRELPAIWLCSMVWLCSMALQYGVALQYGSAVWLCSMALQYGSAVWWCTATKVGLRVKLGSRLPGCSRVHMLGCLAHSIARGADDVRAVQVHRLSGTGPAHLLHRGGSAKGGVKEPEAVVEEGAVQGEAHQAEACGPLPVKAAPGAVSFSDGCGKSDGC